MISNVNSLAIVTSSICEPLAILTSHWSIILTLYLWTLSLSQWPGRFSMAAHRHDRRGIYRCVLLRFRGRIEIDHSYGLRWSGLCCHSRHSLFPYHTIPYHTTPHHTHHTTPHHTLPHHIIYMIYDIYDMIWYDMIWYHLWFHIISTHLISSPLISSPGSRGPQNEFHNGIVFYTISPSHHTQSTSR